MFWIGLSGFLSVLVLVAGVFCIMIGLTGSPGGLLVFGIIGIIVQKKLRRHFKANEAARQIEK